MTLYSVVLFAHVTAVLTLFAALSFEVLSLFHLRRASSPSEAGRWIDLVPGLPLVSAGSLLVILLSGIYLAMRMSAFELSWPKVAIGAFFHMAPLGALTGKRTRAIRRAYPDATAMNPELLRRLRDPFLKSSLGIRINVFLGIVLLMAAKPGMWESISIVGASVILGFLSSFAKVKSSAGQSGKLEVSSTGSPMSVG